MEWKTTFKKFLVYGIFVFLSVWLVLTLRSASLIWIHNIFMGNPWKLFKHQFRFCTFISLIQTPIMLLCALIYYRFRRTCGLRHVAGATLLLCILNLFIRPIGFWTQNYRIICPTLTIGAVFVFPLLAWLVLFFLPINRKPADRVIQNNK